MSLFMPTTSTPAPMFGKLNRTDVSVRCCRSTAVHVSGMRRWNLMIACASPSTINRLDSMAILERCFVAPDAENCSEPSSRGDRCAVMKMKHGFRTVTLEKGKIDLSQKKSDSLPEVALGGGGGGIGKKIYHSNNGDDDGDDDDYFVNSDEYNTDVRGLFRRRKIFDELFHKKFVDAVLNEWHKTLIDLPAGFQQAYEMGLVSSAQIVRFLAINARPTIARFISRALPQAISGAFIGRMIADPAFLYKLLLEVAATGCCSVYMELKSRKDRIKQEWDLALVNVLTTTACNAVVVWSLAPCCSYRNIPQFGLQNVLRKLPNNVFERSYPHREFNGLKRISSFFTKAAGLYMVGLTAGSVQGSLSDFLAYKKDRVHVRSLTVRDKALGYGAFLGLHANLRHQLLCGIDAAVLNHFDVIGVSLFFCTALRVLSTHFGEAWRLACLPASRSPEDDVLFSSPSSGRNRTVKKMAALACS